MHVVPVQALGRKLRTLPMTPAPAVGFFEPLYGSYEDRLWASKRWRVLVIGRPHPAT